MTKVEMFNAIANVPAVAEIDGAVDFLHKEAEMTAKRNARKSTTPTKTQRENEGVKENIVAFLTGSEGNTATEIGKALEISTQKASALLRQLIAEGKVEKNMVKKVAYFKLAA